jgi:alpha-2-macroglobulin
MKNLLILILLICITTIFVQCEKETSVGLQPGSLISFHTSGMISRESTIKVVFFGKMIPDYDVGKSITDSPFDFSPSIKGTTKWSNERTLEFRPEERLPGGKSYEVKLNLAKFTEEFYGYQDFSFRFNTIKQTFSIQIDQLHSVSQTDLKEQKLSGELITADSEDGMRIEKILKVVQDGKDLNIKWLHAEDRRKHQFIISGIIRKENESKVLISWDGDIIDVDDKGEMEVNAPAIGSFEVTDVKPVQDKTAYIEIVFSDPLDKNQNLDGLIRISQPASLRFEILLNTIRVYRSGKWEGGIDLIIDPAVKNVSGYKLGKGGEYKINFQNLKPQVKFVGKGVILPSSSNAKLAIETVNLNAVVVEATQIYEKNIPQFLQENILSGEYELNRVGQVIWEDTVDLNLTSDKVNQWIRHGLDLTPLTRNYPHGMYRIRLYFLREHVEYECQDIIDEDEETMRRQRWSEYYQNRDNPCHPAYYEDWYDHKIMIARNVLISDIGLLAKRDDENRVLVVSTDLKTGEAVSGTGIELYNFQQKMIAKGSTFSDGMVMLEPPEKPFLVIAHRGDQVGYLKIDDGSALTMSQFEVEGKQSPVGIKGFIYGERGVWRPGNEIYLTFLLFDPDDKIPATHPVRLDFYNARNQHIKTMINTKPVNGFYHFKLKTNEDDPTGNWRVKIRIGGAIFEKIVKVETIMPNRLDIDLDFGPLTALKNGRIGGDITAKWLHGAPAKNLKADIEMGLKSTKTTFKTYKKYNFDDPARNYQPETFMIFDGKLNEKGEQVFGASVFTRNTAPGMLTANFKARVFESSGAFSTEQFSMPFHPYDQYVGIYLPELESGNNRIETDTSHVVQLVLLNHKGNPVNSGTLDVKVYKIQWRWWWERDRRSLADYMESARYDPVISEKVKINDGVALWQLKIKGRNWSRYLIRVSDELHGHTTGQIVYAYTRGWRGRDQSEGTEGISTLNLTTDKKEYTVGEEIALTIPTSSNGRGLVTVESGNEILETHHIFGKGEPLHFKLKASKSMVPNIYINVSYWQPHQNLDNDLPIRMYGVAPVSVYDPGTRISPEIEIADALRPESQAELSVFEKQGKAMTYTVAIVDEGLLNLTGFKTPNPWDQFFQKEALSIKTWDLYDFVSGAYGGAWESLLAIGGGDAAEIEGQKKADRFPPMVIYMGPFELKAGGKNTHQFNVPQYVGSVRVMVIAANQSAFGATDKAVAVKKPLMVLGTLPRVLGPGEIVDLPVAVFAMEDNVTQVTVQIEANELLSIVGPDKKQTMFDQIGDQMITFKLKAMENAGIARITINASGDGEDAEHNIELNIRHPNRPVTDVYQTRLKDSGDWDQNINNPGIPGTNTAMLEISRIPPLNLGRRLQFLIRYPHGCVEQTTSAAFPQLYIAKLLSLPEEKQRETEKNVKSAIDKLRNFQTGNGGFSYWPGYYDYDSWSSNYAGHFLVEAQKMGYAVPELVLNRWLRFQKNQALSWVTGPRRSALIQSYRLYTLALAGKPELGAMNRLKEDTRLNNTAKWRLAAAYILAGQEAAANEIASRSDLQTDNYRELTYTYGSGLRDKSMILESLSILGRTDQAAELVEQISEELCSQKWLSTQTTAYALIAMARYAGISAGNIKMKFDYTWNQVVEKNQETSQPVYQQMLDPDQKNLNRIQMVNEGETVIYPRVIMEGIPKVGSETAGENGMALKVSYKTMEGVKVNPGKFEQGSDFIVEIMVKNTGNQGRYDEIALSHLLPSGFEIQNTRMSEVDRTSNDSFDYQDIRDDRIYTYFDLKPGEAKRFQVVINASYQGKFYLPMISAEAMYDATIYARVPGQWIEIVRPGMN